MKLRYWIVDQACQLQRVSGAKLEELWSGELRADALGCRNDRDLYLASVVCDGRLMPKKIFLLRLPLTEGRFTVENYLTLRLFTRPDCVTAHEAIDHHTTGWPRDFFKQLAVAMDVPLKGLEVPLGIGGPLYMAAAMRVTPREAMRYLK